MRTVRIDNVPKQFAELLQTIICIIEKIRFARILDACRIL